MAFPNVTYGSPGYEKSVSTTKKNRIGSKMVFADGRTFYYMLAGEAITAGLLTMGAQTATDHVYDLAVAAASAVGDQTIELTNGGSTAIAVGDYNDGYLFINDEDGQGQIFTISSHTAAATGASCTFTLYDGDSVQTALTTSSKAGIHKPVGHSVEMWDASDIDGPILGVPQCDIASGEYFWNQTSGPGCVLAAGTWVLGNEVFSSTDGAAGPSVADNSVENKVGMVLAIQDAGDYGLVDLQIKY